jgi:hypothetical protein
MFQNAIALSTDLSNPLDAIPNSCSWWAWAIVDARGGGSDDGLLPGDSWVIGVCGQYTCTAGGFRPNLLDAIGPLDVGGIYIYMGLESPNDVACGGSGDMGCFSLDTGDIEICLASREGCLEIWESELSYNWDVKV